MPFRKKHRRRDEHRCYACRRRTPSTVNVNGLTVRTMYCPTCACTQAAGGQLCMYPRRYRTIPYCAQHLQCTAGGCHRDVKEFNPRTFRLCTSHACKAPHCPDRREPGSDFCPAHKCIRPGCAEGRHPSGRSQYCARHTCESPECGNLVLYDGCDPPATDPRRYCNQHRRCERPGCVRRCHMHDDGSMAPFCGDHRCHSGGCGKEGNLGQFCDDHKCRFPGCNAGFANEANGRFCADHECARVDCRRERYRSHGFGSTFCHEHKCRDPDCVREVMGEYGWCERHQPCLTEGCRRQRVMEGERVTDHCEQHTPPACAWHHPKCTNRAVDGGRFCDDHTCTVRDCTEERDPQVPRSTACVEHRCTADLCGRVRQNPFNMAYGAPLPNHHTFCLLHACQYTARRCMSQAVEHGRYCKRHGCAVQDCPEEARAYGGKLCLDHAATREERMRGAAGREPRIAAGVDQMYEPRRPGYGFETPIVLGGGLGYGFEGVPGGGMMPGVGYQYGPGRYEYRF
ncbi:hypothetical protein CONLIGDRAFT_454927 [Coniochaeta ligniaria NRRL 30616]|uniref:Uncharacterized protein n=1 Tax=Coniochaeta ligniaria NRRL 30616 TaxID=1408157 RepID=A0A1J7J3R8_9PEZI|nr:hypothetical protein CONLIGDRAFT_454927 [Coniochaeta ligniaria NRRL 30616]